MHLSPYPLILYPLSSALYSPHSSLLPLASASYPSPLIQLCPFSSAPYPPEVTLSLHPLSFFPNSALPLILHPSASAPCPLPLSLRPLFSAPYHPPLILRPSFSSLSSAPFPLPLILRTSTSNPYPQPQEAFQKRLAHFRNVWLISETFGSLFGSCDKLFLEPTLSESRKEF